VILHPDPEESIELVGDGQSSFVVDPDDVDLWRYSVGRVEIWMRPCPPSLPKKFGGSPTVCADRWRLASTEADSAEVGPEQTLRGRFVKVEKAREIHFRMEDSDLVADDVSLERAFRVAGWSTPRGGEVMIRGRVIDVQCRTHSGWPPLGPRLWISKIIR
jgi:hypothetical protein